MISTAEKLLENFENREAVSVFTAVLEVRENSAVALLGRGTAYYWVGDYQRSLTDLSMSVSIDPGNVLAREELSFVYIQTDEPDKAIEHLSHAIRIEPQRHRLWTLLASAYAQMGRGYEAVHAIDMSRMYSSDEPRHYRRRAELYEDIGEFSMAIDELDRMFHIISTRNASVDFLPESLRLYARLCVLEGKISDAICSLEKLMGADELMGTDETSHLDHSLLAKCYASIGDFSKAIAVLDDFIEHHGQNCDLILHRGRIHLHCEQYSKAVRDFTYVLEQRKDSDAYLLRGKAFHGAEMYYEALCDFDVADQSGDVEAEQARAECVTMLLAGAGMTRHALNGDLSHAENQLSEVISHHDHFLTAFPSHPLAWWHHRQRGLLLLNGGFHSEAEADLRKAMELVVTDGTAITLFFADS